MQCFHTNEVYYIYNIYSKKDYCIFFFISYLLCFPIKKIRITNSLTLPKEPCPKTLRRSNWSDEAFSQPSLVISLTSNSETTAGSIVSCKEGFVSRFSRFDLEGVELKFTDSWLLSSSVVVSSLELALRSCYEICIWKISSNGNKILKISSIRYYYY